jgi:histidyl-tRNA synthetase
LIDKHGEDSKLIWNIEDQGGELYALRYDLAAPLVRWLAMNNKRHIKRFKIDKCTRETKLRLSMLACSNSINTISSMWDARRLGAGYKSTMHHRGNSEVFELDVAVNTIHHLILDGIFAAVGVPKDMVRPISSAVGKLDKM